MRSAAEAHDRLCDPSSGVSAHYVIHEDGGVDQLVDEGRRAWHAGKGRWRSFSDLNDVSIGLEIVNPGHEWGYRPFPAVQIAAVAALSIDLVFRWRIRPWDVIGHSDMAPTRKMDPGELFPWPELARRGVGLWPRGGRLAADGDLERSLSAIGYPVAQDGLNACILAFQRRFSPWRMNGCDDPPTARRAAQVAQAYVQAAYRSRGN